jgi:hypothetical protein
MSTYRAIHPRTFGAFAGPRPLFHTSVLLAPDQPGAGGGGADDGEGGGDDKGDQTPAGGAGKVASGGDKTFAQKDIDTAVANERRKLNEKHLKETEELLNSKNLSEKERERLSKRKDELETALMTTQEKARADKEKLEKEYNEKLKTSDDNAKTWQSRYAKAAIKRAITDAAVLSNAHDPSQIVELLENRARIQEIVGEDGAGTGEFEVVIEQSVKNEKTGKMEKKVMLVDKYIAEVMTEEPRNKNLFDSGRVSGTGHRPGSSGGRGGAALTSVQRIAKGLGARGIR